MINDDGTEHVHRVIRQQELVAFAWRRARNASTLELRERWERCARDLEAALADFIEMRRRERAPAMAQARGDVVFPEVRTDE